MTRKWARMGVRRLYQALRDVDHELRPPPQPWYRRMLATYPGWLR